MCLNQADHVFKPRLKPEEVCFFIVVMIRFSRGTRVLRVGARKGPSEESFGFPYLKVFGASWPWLRDKSQNNIRTTCLQN